MRFTSLFILIASAVACLVIGYRYFTRGSFMPYQEAAAGVRFDDLGPGLRIVIQAMMHVIGGGFGGLGLSLMWFGVELCSGQMWAGGAILSVSVVTLAPALFATRYIAELGHHEQPPSYLLSGLSLAILLGVLVAYL